MKYDQTACELLACPKCGARPYFDQLAGDEQAKKWGLRYERVCQDCSWSFGTAETPEAANALWNAGASAALSAPGTRDGWQPAYARPLIEAIAAWEREHGTVAAIMPDEYEGFCKLMAYAAVRSSARAAAPAPEER